MLCLTAPPSIIGNHRTPENISVVEKSSVSLNCEASGIPLPSITWLKDGWPVNLSSSLRILSGIKNSCSLVIWLASCGHSLSLISHISMFYFFPFLSYLLTIIPTDHIKKKLWNIRSYRTMGKISKYFWILVKE